MHSTNTLIYIYTIFILKLDYVSLYLTTYLTRINFVLAFFLSFTQSFFYFQTDSITMRENSCMLIEIYKHTHT